MTNDNICKSTIVFGDDYGDNNCTFHCQLELGHPGKHQENGNMYWEQPYTLLWEHDYIDPFGKLGEE